jgi:ribosome-binding protein aMBF1 (putative translation factor)
MPSRRDPSRAIERLREALERLDDPDFVAYAERIGRRVAEERTSRGLSQRELAELCGTTQSAVARLEGGTRPPRLSTLLRVANALDCELELDLRPRTTPTQRMR